MLDKNYLFIFVSIILGVIISLYYVKKFNNKFIMYTLIITIVFYIIFYYLGNTKNMKENYENNYGTNFYNSNFYNSKFYDSNNLVDQEQQQQQQQQQEQEQEQHEENNHMTYNYNNIITSVTPEEEQNIDYKKFYLPEEDINGNPVNEKHITSEESSEHSKHSKHRKHSEHSEHERNIDIPFDEDYDTQHNISKKILSNETIPININISYNAQNSTNSNNNNKLSQNENENENEMKKNTTSNNNSCSRNLGNIGGISRIYNNSDWIYGTNAWTNSPDYYIPDKNCYNCDNCPKPLNEIATARKYKENNNVCPLMINTPWSEFKSGDDIPEPYNV